MRYVWEKTIGGDDCLECCFRLTCTDVCRLALGWHWRDTEQSKQPGAAGR